MTQGIRSLKWYGQLTLLVVVLIFLCTFFSTLDVNNEEFISDGKVNFEGARKHWLFQFSILPITVVGRNMIDVGAKLSTYEAHVLTHTFGQALYEHAGMRGVNYCVMEYMGGCFDQFVGTVILERGVGEAQNLYSHCVDRSDACKHGIGHGIVGNYGYDLNSLNRAIQLCESIVPNNLCSEPKGILVGIFMEYNFHEMEVSSTGGIQRLRKYDPNNKFYPCFTVNRKYREACVIELPLWWYFSNKKNDPVHDLVSVGKYCLELTSDPRLRQICFRGLGAYTTQFVGVDLKSNFKVCNNSANGLITEKGVCLGAIAVHFEREYGATIESTCSKFETNDEITAICRHKRLIDTQ